MTQTLEWWLEGTYFDQKKIYTCDHGASETQNILISRFIGQNHMVVGQDSGALVLVNLTKERDGDTLTHYLETQVHYYNFGLSQVCGRLQ